VKGLLLAAACSLAPGCAQVPSGKAERTAAATARVESSSPPARSARAPLHGRAFPDKVLSLTWDDGPDEQTYELARYLHGEHISATFFVVGAWVPGLSSDPGEGRRVFETGYDSIHVLSKLAGLGHRVENHTRNHVLLGDAPPETVAYELRENERALAQDPAALHLFRAPGGAWSAAASAAVDADPELARLVGPVHWDIDGKDWEASLYCRSEQPEIECEPAAPGGRSRVKPAVTAKRYLAIVESVGHGIVLLHDRVGHVGSDYALRVARALIPELEARGYVFAAPVLRFSPLAPSPRPKRASASPVPPPDLADAFGGPIDPAAVRVADINGDGRADVCARTHEGLGCALSDGRSLLRATLWFDGLGDARGFELVDVNDDGRADVCVESPHGFQCGLAP
jgi:peptidoglycan/xylan/chitin deacetylase (PgdA/CDA1 family)